MSGTFPKVTVTHYADPWCWKCWGLEPVLQRLNEVYGDQIRVVYKTGGLIKKLNPWIAEEGLSGFGELNTWIKQTRQEMRIPFDTSYLVDTKPESSWPACIAVEAAGEQGSEAGYRFYRSLVETIQLFSKDGSDRAVQLEVARGADLDIKKFVKDLDNPALKKKLLSQRKTKDRQGMNFSTLMITDEATGKSIRVNGYEPEPYEKAIDKLVEGRLWKRAPIDIIDYIEQRKNNFITAREISSVFSIEQQEARRRLEALSNQGILKRTAMPRVGTFWSMNPLFTSPTLTLEQVELAHVTPTKGAAKPVELERILRPVIKRLYSEVSTQPGKGFHFPVGKDAALRVGYPQHELDQIPRTAVESFAGVNYPFAAQVIRPGDTVLDIGSGAGTDVLVSAQKTGKKGKVIGLDFTEAMIRKARSNIRKAGLRNVNIVKGEATKIPLPDQSVDVITTNGVLNLVVNKEKALGQMYRVLRRGGHVQISDVLVKKDVASVCGIVPQLWAECIGGAAVEGEFIGMMKKVGFADPRIIRRTDYFASSPSQQMKRLAKTFKAESAVVTGSKPR